VVKAIFGALGVPECFQASVFCIIYLKRGLVKKQAAMTAIVARFSCA